MKKELQDNLFKKYPKIFKQKDMPANKTAMCWGISVGDGWYNIIDTLCSLIQDRVDWLNGEGIHTYRKMPKDHIKINIEAVQVKEKWGALRFYLNQSDNYIDGAINLAQSLSSKTCSDCGIPIIKSSKYRGWVYTLCEKCKIKNFGDIDEN
jgi:hypothetical protein